MQCMGAHQGLGVKKPFGMYDPEGLSALGKLLFVLIYSLYHLEGFFDHILRIRVGFMHGNVKPVKLCIFQDSQQIELIEHPEQ